MSSEPSFAVRSSPYLDSTSLPSGRALVDAPAENIVARPFVKWAGGKSRMLPELLSRKPSTFGKYFEPFVGGGAMFFGLQSYPFVLSGQTVFSGQAVLSDLNSEVVNAYTVVRDQVEELIVDLARHKHTRRYFYKIRDVDRKADYWLHTPVEKASRFIYLNKTCFNGLYRVNSRGEFNVPFGDYQDPCIVDAENLRACSKALASVELRHCGFAELEDSIATGDFVYLDPPYVPLNKTSSFTAYHREGFAEADQRQLGEFCRRLDARGVKFMLSNSDTPLAREIYADFLHETVLSARAINSKSEKRGAVSELLVRNYS